MNRRTLIAVAGLLAAVGLGLAQPPVAQEPNTWVKRSPLKTAPVSPGMGYEAALVYDSVRQRVIRWGGHNQGGGGEQNAETWVLDPVSMKWELMEPNRAPPGVCCAQQNVFDPTSGRMIRFPAFSGSHGWHWFRENYLNNTSVWTYDLGTNTWRDLRPAPTPHPRPLRAAAWDSEHQVVVVVGGEGNNDGTHVYDPYTNTWTRMRPRVEPPPRSCGNLAYDAARKLHILFGAQFSDDPHTWAYDLAKNEWRDLKPAVQPPTDRNDAVLAYDAAHKVVIAVVRVADKKTDKDILSGHLETWAFDAGRNTWSRMNPDREPDGWGNRRRIMVAIPDQHLVLMEAYVNPTERVKDVDREQQIWTYRYGPVVRGGLPAPQNVGAIARADGKTGLHWLGVAGAKAYQIFRGEGPVPWQANLTQLCTIKATDISLVDEGTVPGKVYHYRVRAIGTDGKQRLESELSLSVRTQPRLVEDAVVSVVGPKEVRLKWQAPPGTDIAGYHIERAVVEVFSEDEIVRLKKDTPPLAEPSVGAVKTVGAFQRLTKQPINAREFTDTRIDLTKPQTAQEPPVFAHRFAASQLDANGKAYRFAVYAYRVRAVNARGVEGGASPYFLTIPAAPQFLFAREEGEKCHLKWQANDETGLKGYRVYRMEGPRINGPGQKVTRLTAEPLRGTTYTDAAAGKDTRRFWVVAVDALGQEGFPSAPAWHHRQFRKYYEPFVGAWHQ
jgi:hypothetical protein